MKLAENLNYEFSFLRLQVQYCCASDKYHRGPKMETFLQGWKSGAAAVKSVFRKYEHDWTTVSLISYLLHEKCRCYSPLTSRVTESNLKNLPFYSLYSYLSSCQSSPLLLPLSSLCFLFYFPSSLPLSPSLHVVTLYTPPSSPIALLATLPPLPAFVSAPKAFLLFLLLLLFPLPLLLHVFISIYTPSVPPSVPHLYPFCTLSLPLLYPIFTSSVPHLYPFCTPSLPLLYPSVPLLSLSLPLLYPFYCFSCFILSLPSSSIFSFQHYHYLKAIIIKTHAGTQLSSFSWSERS